MALVTLAEIKEQVIHILPISDTDIYDTQLDILIKGAIAKLDNEGVSWDATDKAGNYIFESDAFATSDLCVCIAYQVIKDMDYDIGYDFMTEQYITRVNALRCSITAKQR